LYHYVDNCLPSRKGIAVLEGIVEEGQVGVSDVVLHTVESVLVVAGLMTIGMFGYESVVMPQVLT